MDCIIHEEDGGDNNSMQTEKIILKVNKILYKLILKLQDKNKRFEELLNKEKENREQTKKHL